MWCGFNLYGLVNSKAKRALQGRRNLFIKLQEDISRIKSSENRIWFHSSSMGEFEQAKPIIAELKKRIPAVQIIVSFFSPSGYEHSLSYKLADVITYIPFDSYSNAKKFVDIIKPTAVVFVRYDIWPNHIWALKLKNIPVFIISATMQAKMYRRIPILRQFIRSLYNNFDFILTVSDNDKKMFDKFRLNRPVVQTVGDTRYDQVMMRSIASKKKQLIDSKILESNKVIVIGSSWSEDDEKLFPVVKQLIDKLKNLVIIWVPHEPTEENLEQMEIKMNGKLTYIRFSHLHQYENERIILVDSVGILMMLYQYAHVAYIGGGFGSGIHNVLEPASYGVPILFGPRYSNSQESIALLNNGGAYVVRDENELYNTFLMLLTDEKKRKNSGDFAQSLVTQNVGATARVLTFLDKVF